MTKLISSILLLLLILGLSMPEYINYCYLSCGNIMHTLCNSVCGVADCQPIDPDEAWRTDIVNYHNKLRNTLALGNVTVGGNGKASNMMTLSYDMHLEYVSACWVYERGEATPDYCRKTKDFENVGQNSWQGIDDVTTPEGVDAFTQFWFSGGNFTNKEVIDNYSQLPQVLLYMNFTQLVWAETTHVGCGRCKNLKINVTVVICNYGPGGNVQGLPTYIRGEPATQCPNGTMKNKKYSGLCGISKTPAEFKTVGILNNTPVSCGVVLMSSLFVTMYTSFSCLLVKKLF